MILSSIIDKIKNEYSLIGKGAELEARFGVVSNGSINVAVPAHVYARIIKKLELPEISIIEDRIINGIRRRTKTIANNETVVYSRKCRKNKWELLNYGILVELSKEENIDADDPNLPNFDDVTAYNRSMIRRRYLFEGGNVVVEVSTINVNNNGLLSTHFEIEVELFDSKALDNGTFVMSVDDLYTYAYDTRKVFTLGQYHVAMNILNHALGSGNVLKIPKIRHVIAEDLRFGGIIKNPYLHDNTSYMVLYKPQNGRHSLLLVLSDGIWIYNVNGQYLSYYMDNNELYGSEVDGRGFSVTIIDGFFIDYKGSQTAFYMQDVVMHNNLNVSNYPNYNTRIVLGKELAIYLKETSLQVINAIAMNFNNPKQFYEVLDNMINNMHSFEPGFKVSGLIFKPASTPYYPTNTVFNNNILSLVQQPSIVKWIIPSELSIDLHIKWMGSGNMMIYTSDGKEFIGSTSYPLSSMEIPPTDNININIIPSGQLVEFKYDSVNKKLIPSNLRYDKVIGNNYLDAELIWNNMNNSITVNTLKGKDSLLSNYYIIRRELELINDIKEQESLVYFGLPHPIIIGALSIKNIRTPTFFIPGSNENDMKNISNILIKDWGFKG